jgi:uncharacterized protein with PIN domain
MNNLKCTKCGGELKKLAQISKNNNLNSNSSYSYEPSENIYHCEKCKKSFTETDLSKD